MLHRIIVVIAMALPMLQTMPTAYATEGGTSVNIQNMGNNSTHTFRLKQGEKWSTALNKVQAIWGPGDIMFHGNKVDPNAAIPNLVNEHTLAYIPIQSVTMLSSKELEQKGMQLMDSHAENDITQGSILMALSQIKSAMEKHDWVTARRRFDRMGEEAKSGPIAIEMKKEIDKH